MSSAFSASVAGFRSVRICSTRSVRVASLLAPSQQQLDDWLKRKLDTLDLQAVMIDGIDFRDSVILLALGIDAKGNKHVLGLREAPPRPPALCARCCCLT